MTPAATPHDRLNALLRQAGVSRTVYACVMPETEAAFDALLDADRESLRDMYRAAWTQKQDALHMDFLETWRAWVAPALAYDAAGLSCAYATAGASEAIREAIYAYGHRARQEGFSPVIHVFEGEYEGYAAYAQAAGIAVVRHDRARWRETLSSVGPRDQFYVSQPSAIDGNIWQNFDAFSSALLARQEGAALMLDVTYAGCVARPFRIDARGPNVQAVFFSLSKPMGLYYHRVGGMLSREAYPGLFGNRWFKNLLSLRLGTEMMKRHGLYDLPARYLPKQQAALAAARTRLGLNLTASDVWLLAHGTAGRNPAPLEKYLYREGTTLRACLTPLIAGGGPVQARPHEGLEET